MLIDYHERIDSLDILLNKLTSVRHNKFYILCFFHYVVFVCGIYIPIFFTTSLYQLVTCGIILICQFILNIYDRGCFAMKLERKYIGKTWYGPYTLINYLYEDETVINTENMLQIYMYVSFIIMCIVLYRIQSLL